MYSAEQEDGSLKKYDTLEELFAAITKEKITIRERIGWFLGDIRSFWYNCKYGVRNLVKWFPVIWRDRSWDHCFIHLLMEQKLKFVYKEMSRDNRVMREPSEDSSKQLRALKHCIHLNHVIACEDFGDCDNDEHEENLTKAYELLHRLYLENTRYWWT